MHLKEAKEAVNGIVIDIVNCPGHYAPIAKVKYDNGENVLMFGAEGVKVGDVLTAGSKADIKPGNVAELKNIPEGTLVYKKNQFIKSLNDIGLV